MGTCGASESVSIRKCASEQICSTERELTCALLFILLDKPATRPDQSHGIRREPRHDALSAYFARYCLAMDQPGTQFVVTPWRTSKELLQLRHDLYGSDALKKERAVSKVS